MPTDKPCPECGRGGRSFHWKWIILGTLVVAIWWWINSGSSVEKVVEGQLQKFKEHALTEAYYSYTSRLFQETTSLEKFREFVATYTLLSHFQELLFLEEKSDETGIVRAQLTDEESKSQRFEWRLIKEGRQWKIVSLQHLSSETASPEDEKKVLKVITVFLQALRTRDMETAYNQVSREFSHETSQQQLEKFLENYQIFREFERIEPQQKQLTGNEGEFLVVLHANSANFPVEITVLKQEQDWKIWGIRLILPERMEPHQKLADLAKTAEVALVNNGLSYPPKASTIIFEKKNLEKTIEKPPMEIVESAVGNEVNQEGIIVSREKIFEAQDKIFLTIKLIHAVKGIEVTVRIEHIETGGETQPVSSIVQESGPVFLSFAFLPPGGGWPKGRYLAMFATSTGKRDILEFQIR